jgi:anoctamin-1
MPVWIISYHVSLFAVAFSTNFIPRLVHDFSKDLSGQDYLDFTLAYFNTSDFEVGSRPESDKFGEVAICRYPEFRNGPDMPKDLRYKRPYHYWKILTARLAFIIVYQNVVAWIQQFIDWLIPDKPDELDSLIKRENFLVSSKIIREERNKVLQFTQRKKNEVDYVNGGVFYEARS